MLEAEVRDDVGREVAMRRAEHASRVALPERGIGRVRMKTAEGVFEFAASQVRDTAEPLVSGIRQYLADCDRSRSRTWRSSSTHVGLSYARHRRRLHGRSRMSAAKPGSRSSELTERL